MEDGDGRERRYADDTAAPEAHAALEQHGVTSVEPATAPRPSGPPPRDSRPARGLRRLAAAPEGPAAAAALLGVLAAAEVVARRGAGGQDGHDGYDGQLPAVLLLALAATAPVALLRTRPAVAATAATAACALLLGWLPWPPVAALAAQLAALYVLGRRGRPRALAPLLTLPLVGHAAYVLGDTGAASADGERLAAVAAAVPAVAAAVAGLARRARREAAAHSATERAIAETLYEHAARGERARIARELHDVVAHHISMISVQAETARLTTPGMPDEGARRLRDIGDTARTALTEMRRLLGVLREDAGAAPAERRPQPGLDRLNELLDEARDASGAAVRLIVSGRVRPLDPGLELTAYRIVQEALTNVRRHAPGAAVDVELRYAPDALRLRVRDNGPGPVPGAGAGAGHGLLGMRERAASAGGRLRSGPAAGGGFLLEAVFPAAGTEAGTATEGAVA